MSDQITKLEALLGGPRDGALLRHSLGIEYLRGGRTQAAIDAFRQAVAFDAAYSAAWKNLGRALAEAGQVDDALAAYQEGIAVANRRGDLQAAKEMTVFARRLARRPGGG
ncbi:MAG: tetratricopeptide repeat protein [Rhodocyclaceae bacterium]|nr:tetratricopeptide repeat protein [Rhodocyclaceae bacterium]